MVRVYIPTRGRLDNQVTYPLLKAAGLEPILICPPNEVEEHAIRKREAWARPVSGIANVRQWIVDQHDIDDTVIMCDDDLGFFVRANPNAWNLKPAEFAEVASIFENLHSIIQHEGYAHAGITPRQMNNVHFPNEYIEIGKMNAVHAINKQILEKEQIRYNAVELMEDYFVTLSLLRKGYRNKLIAKAAWDQKGVSGAAGGCSLSRTPEKQAEGARKLAELFPQTVKVVEKTPKGGWGDGQKSRTDVRIQWVKTFNIGASNV